MLELREVSKSFPGVKALNNVSIKFNPSEIHALLGENGAGKSTLINIISGVYKPDKGGKVLFNDLPYEVNSTHEALEKGIHTVYQNLQIVPQASVAENIMLDKLPTRGRTGFIDWKKMNQVAQENLDIVGLKIRPSTPLGRLSIAQRQLVEIAKALASDIKILLLDEPTSSLTKDEAQHLFKIMGRLRENGVLIIFVSHVLEEVLQVAERISILRDGHCVVTEERENLDRKAIVRHMIGREEDTDPMAFLI